ncbi:hypothetical protein ACO2Q3_11585 [Caulobacter sp. KR2-114]|uniref:hypothetical protein n=1 Tax=Caulobacter sp. KR2-114 TaxID=3400912 RepID=UPI003C02D5D9
MGIPSLGRLDGGTAFRHLPVMKPRQQAPSLAVTPTSAAFFAIAVLVAGTALAGRMLTAWEPYEPRPGLVCPNDGRVDFSQLAGHPPAWRSRDPERQAFLEKARLALAARPWQGAPGVRIQVRGTLAPSQSTISASRASTGAWILTLDQDNQRLGGADAHARVALSKTQGEDLERMLADPCLYAEPELIGTDFPTASGGPGSCFDGADTSLDIRWAGRRRTAVQVCQTYGLTGDLAHFLYGALDEAEAAKRTA